MGKPSPYDRRAVAAWALFDFGNSAFSALVLTFIYSTYFTAAIAPNNIVGTILWSRGVAVSGVLVAILSPFLGALADRGALRKKILALMTFVAVVGSASLFFVLPGQVIQALSLFVIANLGIEIGMVFYNSFLPEIAPADRIGRISGFGWSLGYLGGLIAMMIALVGFVRPEEPWFGFVRENGEHIRATNLLVAAWFGIFSLPLFIWVRERRVLAKPRFSKLFKESLLQIGTTFREIRNYREIVRLLVARLFYNDAILTIFTFGGIYAKGTFGFSFDEIMVFGIVLNVAAGVGAFALGFLDDLLGGKRTIQVTNWAFVFASTLAVLAPDRTYFWIAGIIVGLFSGPNQAASRSLMGRFVPEEKESEFFGFFAFSGKATAFVGPLVLGVVTEAFDSQRAGISIVLVFFVVGIFLLNRVDEATGKRFSGRSG